MLPAYSFGAGKFGSYASVSDVVWRFGGILTWKDNNSVSMIGGVTKLSAILLLAKILALLRTVGVERSEKQTCFFFCLLGGGEEITKNTNTTNQNLKIGF